MAMNAAPSCKRGASDSGISRRGRVATDYSLQNTLRQAVETFFWRAGDMLSAITILVVVQILVLGVHGFALINLAVVALWLLIGTNLKRENQPPDEVAAGN